MIWSKMAVGKDTALIIQSFILLTIFSYGFTQVLTPPYFNLAGGRQIEATATCGVGVAERELFCKLTGANPDTKVQYSHNYEVIQGQLCDYCDENNVAKMHPAEFAIDGTERWWQSPPLSRGLELNAINLTINLGQEFHVAYVFLRMANSPRPGIFALERSTDYGQTYKPWQYFADSMSDCNDFFGDNYEEKITRDDSVVCTTEYSKVVPLEGGEIVVSLVNNRPNANNFSFSQTLQDWTKATNIRLRLLRTKTLLGHLMAVARQDPTVVRRYYYSIKDISLGGRCVCNGHASVCDKTDPVDQFKLLCRCQHNTCGDQCEKCCDGYVQKPWRPATLSNINECEPCQCYGHTYECIYDEQVALNRTSIDIHGLYEGGGVCQNCRHNTMGINCEKCMSGYYRPYGVPLNSTNVCNACRCDPIFSTGDCEDGSGRCYCKPQYTGPSCRECSAGYFGWPRCDPCDCNVNGTRDQICEAGGGQCPCKVNYAGANCDQCAYGYYGFPECRPCNCDSIGSLSSYCDPASGECTCRNNYQGRDCSTCARGFFNYPSCDLCDCDPTGSTEEICNQDVGTCICRENYSGDRCQQCGPGYFSYPDCMECGCAEPGSITSVCDQGGQCMCEENFSGVLCDSCAPGFYKYPACQPCNCDPYGAYGVTCDQETGQCTCRFTFEGLMCDRCKENFYNYPVCEACTCNPAGAKEVPGYPLGGCGAHLDGRLCECKDRVIGRICDTCKPTFYNLNALNALGCEECDCHIPGVVGGNPVCDTVTGQCVCKPFVGSRQCDECIDGTYNLVDFSPFGCSDCDCDMGGSISSVCDKVTGQCPCRPRVTGRRCDIPIATHFFTNLYHIMYEMEDGYTPEGGRVRYGFDDQVFEDFSWRGYAIYSQLQNEVLVDIDVTKPSLYRIIFRYVNSDDDPVHADITVTPEVSSDVRQSGEIVFQSSDTPHFATVSSIGVATSFVLNPGKWTVSLSTPEHLLVDYVVLLPQDYYEGGILQQVVNRPCQVPATNELCRHYVYIDVSTFPSVPGVNAYIRKGNERERTQLFPDTDVGDQLGAPNMAYLDPNQPSVSMSLPIPEPGPYIFVMLYYSRESPSLQGVDVEVASSGGRENGQLALPSCPYSSLCRQVVTNEDGLIKVFMINGTYVSLTLTGYDDIDLAIDSVVAIPVRDWNIEWLQPKLECLMQDGQCVDTSFFSPTGSVRTEVEAGENEILISTDVPPSIVDLSVKVIKIDESLPTVHVNSSVTSSGSYVFISHYYQPEHSGFDVDVDVYVDGTVHRGTMRVDYCPSHYGCRAVVQFPDQVDMQSVDLSSIDFSISFNSTSGRPVWLDYVVVVPSVQFSKDVLEVQGVDKSVEFITKCGSNDFYVDPETEGFCRNVVYSLATSYNNGALECNCNTDGSTSFTCEPFGGQCRCRANVIGRTCSQCRTGFYGFPSCRPCNCPSTGLCDPVSGQCVCPPRVTGANCDTCMPNTYGYDRFIGCEDCNCNPQGVDTTQVCDVETGRCSCRPNIGGRRCDQCLDGYYRFPRCYECDCAMPGTMEEICHKDSAECVCKENVRGDKCDVCAESTFYLEERNEYGCTSCFCFHITTTCGSSYYRRTQVDTMEYWAVTNILEPFVTQHANYAELRVAPDNVFDDSIPIYWIAPDEYLGNKVTSYGGKLTYTVRFRLPRSGESQVLLAPDVRIEGNNFTIIYTSVETPEPGVSWTVELDMLESRFVHEFTGAPVGREQFMMALQNIDALHIRGSYYTAVSSVRISDVSLDMATADGEGEQALNVERCDCPPNYIGTSCEMCAPGYFRSRTGPYLGICVPCQCNNRADVCDPDSGVCQNCRDNFEGPQCLACRPGHYHNPASGVCEMCACPMALESNNFASSCVLMDDRVSLGCFCDEGYIGRNCGFCDYGYWGDPREIGSSCQLCQCNNNIDIQDRTSCDIRTGDCLKCLNNTVGEYCERCADWYFGDAITEKNCLACDCDMHGSVRCDYRTGSCLCKSNVVGPRCERCAAESFGFEYDPPCQDCDCAEAAYDNNCDAVTGECRCRPGVTGRKCDRCERGFWNYGLLGCSECQCEFEGAVTCDTVTGQCQCLPGVTGPKCDMCLPRWAMIPDEGCIECDNCIHLLLDDSEIVTRDVVTIINELESVSVGQGAIRRLEAINNTVHELRPQVDSMISDPTDPSLLDPLVEELIQVQRKTNEVRNKGDRMVREAQLLQDDAGFLLNAARELDVMVNESADIGSRAVVFAEGVLQEILSNIEQKNVDALLQRAEDILVEINDRNFTAEERATHEELIQAVDLLTRARMLYNKANNQSSNINDYSVDMGDIIEKLQDLNNGSRHSLDNSQASADLNEITTQIIESSTGMIADIISANQSTHECVAQSNSLISSAHDLLDSANQTYQGLEAESSTLDAITEDLVKFVAVLNANNTELRPLVNNATEYAYSLQQQATYLESLIADTRESAEGALNASNAYKAILGAINEAYNASLEAIDSSEQALGLLTGLADEARQSKSKSEILYLDAVDTANKVHSVLPDKLQEAKDNTSYISTLNDASKNSLLTIQSINNLPEDGFRAEAEEANQIASEAQTHADQANSRIEGIVTNLPDIQTGVEQLQMMTMEANRAVVSGHGDVNSMLSLIPDATELLDKLDSRAMEVNVVGEMLSGNISALRRQIQLARDQSKLINVGMTFGGESTLQLRNPRGLADAGSHSQLSMFFKTKATDGFLAYIGPDRNAVQMIDDYLALEMVDGLVQFRFDLGDGPGTLTSTKNVSDGKWHEVIAERTSKTAKLTIRTPDEDDLTVEGVSPGTYSVLDLNPATTKFYVGGVPSSAGLDHLLGSTRFVGEVEEVKFGGNQQGLWDFVAGSANGGCVSRNVLKGVSVNGFLFDGDGYVILDKDRFNPRLMARVSFMFKTFEPDGLMFLMGQPESLDFFSVEIKEGKVVFQYDLGSNPAEMTTQQTYNDGQWHKVSVVRNSQNGLIKIDDGETATGRSRGRMKDLDIDDLIYIGGYKGEHVFEYVTQKRFKGCIKDVGLGSITRRISDNLEAKGVTGGCSEMARIVSFTADQANAHLMLDVVNIGQEFQITMKVKTVQSNGLLFYATDDSADQENAFSVSMVNGKFTVIATNDGVRTELQTGPNLYSDGRWHYLSVTKAGRDLQVDIDDLEMVSTRVGGDNRRIITTTPLYFGGVPASMSVVTDNVGTMEVFVGCIGDVTVNGKFQNFAQIPPTSIVSASLAGCPLPDSLGPVKPTRSPQPSATMSPGVGDGQCALSIEPATENGDNINGTRYGMHQESRTQYAIDTTTIDTRSDFVVEFKTTSSDGVIFYMSDERHVDFIGLFLKNGQINYRFNCGSGPAEITSDLTYNDGEWHKVMFSRDRSTGQLVIDGEEDKQGNARGDTNNMNVNPECYVGGLPAEVAQSSFRNLEDVTKGFVGCLRGVSLYDTPLSEPTFEEFTYPCSAMVETGTYFTAEEGYITLLEEFTVGRDLDIALDIKPRSLSGVLLSVFNAGGDYLVLQLVDGGVIFNVDNGEGEIMANSSHMAINSLCDGNWHSIRAVKATNVVTLSVDGVVYTPGIGSKESVDTNTHDPLYVGGVPASHQGLKTEDSFIGCMKNLHLRSEIQNLASGTIMGGVQLNTCPTN